MSSSPPSAMYGLSMLLLRPLAEVLARMGESPAAFLDQLGVDAETNGGNYVDAERVDRALDQIATDRGDASFGLTLATAAVASPFGFFGHLVWMSSTLREALERALRFYSLMTQRAWLELIERRGRAVVIQHLMPNARRGAVLTEFAFAALALYARSMGGERLRLHAVRLMHTSRDLERYGEILGAAVHLGSTADELHFDASLLSAPLGSANPATGEMLAKEAEWMKARRRSEEPFVYRTRKAILSGLRGTVQGLPHLADELSLSARTIQRKLREQGTSHRELLDDVRREVATRLLAEDDTSAIEIARELGFSRPQAFHRAFYRWTGMTPGDFRAVARRTRS